MPGAEQTPPAAGGPGPLAGTTPGGATHKRPHQKPSQNGTKSKRGGREEMDEEQAHGPLSRCSAVGRGMS